MLKKETILKIFEQKLSIESYIILTSIQQNKEDFISLLSYPKVSGIVNLLQRKNYLDEDLNLNENGEKLLAAIGDNQISQETPKTNDFSLFVINLHKKLQDRLVELTGKKQVVISKKYSFLPNAVDLGSKLEKVIRKYKITDLEKIEKILIQHIEKSYKAKWEMVFLLHYYIEKDGISRMITDLENFEELIEQDKDNISEDNFVNL